MSILRNKARHASRNTAQIHAQTTHAQHVDGPQVNNFFKSSDGKQQLQMLASGKDSARTIDHETLTFKSTKVNLKTLEKDHKGAKSVRFHFGANHKVRKLAC